MRYLFLIVALLGMVSVAEARRCVPATVVKPTVKKVDVAARLSETGRWVYSSRGWVFCPGPNCPYTPGAPPPASSNPPAFEFPEDNERAPEEELPIVEEELPEDEATDVITLIIGVVSVIGGMIGAFIATKNTEEIKLEVEAADDVPDAADDLPPELEK